MVVKSHKKMVFPKVNNVTNESNVPYFAGFYPATKGNGLATEPFILIYFNL